MFLLMIIMLSSSIEWRLQEEFLKDQTNCQLAKISKYKLINLEVQLAIMYQYSKINSNQPSIRSLRVMHHPQ